MGIRLPLTTVLSSTNNDEVGAGSIAGGVPISFTIPQDTDGIVVKFRASTVGGGVSAVFQTTDDGGTTWYDVARTSVVSASFGVNTEWMTVPTFGFGYRTAGGIASLVAVGSVVSSGSILQTTGSSGASTLAQRSFSGLPIMSQVGRIFIRITGDLTASSVFTEVKVQDQSATA